MLNGFRGYIFVFAVIAVVSFFALVLYWSSLLLCIKILLFCRSANLLSFGRLKDRAAREDQLFWNFVALNASCIVAQCVHAMRIRGLIPGRTHGATLHVSSRGTSKVNRVSTVEIAGHNIFEVKWWEVIYTRTVLLTCWIDTRQIGTNSIVVFCLLLTI